MTAPAAWRGLLPPPELRDGACRGADPELFWPVSRACRDQVRTALAVCRACPAMRACRDWAAGWPPGPGPAVVGGAVWPDDYAAARAADPGIPRRPTAAGPGPGPGPGPDPRCGTTRGYAAHYARGERPCPACTAAQAGYQRARRAARRAQAPA